MHILLPGDVGHSLIYHFEILADDLLAFMPELLADELFEGGHPLPEQRPDHSGDKDVPENGAGTELLQHLLHGKVDDGDCMLL